MPSVFEPSGCANNKNNISYSRASTNNSNNDQDDTPAGISTRDSLSRLLRTLELYLPSSYHLGTTTILIIITIKLLL